MTESVYLELIQFEEVGGDMVDRTGLLNVHDIFHPLFEYCKGDPLLINPALFYILHTYSFESSYHVLGVDWQDVKDKIIYKLGISPGSHTIRKLVGVEEKDFDFYSELMHLNDSLLVMTVDKYLTYQGNKNFKHLVMLKDLYEQMVRGALEPITKSSGEVDFDQKYKNRGYSSKILEEIDQWEQRVKDKTSKHTKEGKEEVIGKVKKDTSNSLRLEDNLR